MSLVYMHLFQSIRQNIKSTPAKVSIPFVGLVVLLITSWFSLGYYHFDEHFQILEFAGYKLGTNTLDNMPWEYTDQMRPAFQPLLAYTLYRLFGFMGTNDPFSVAFTLRLLSGLLSFLAMVLIYWAFRDRVKILVLQRWFVFLSFLIWFDVYIAVRFSSENWAGRIFAIALAWYLLRERRTAFFSLMLGLLLGVSFLCRYQAAFLVFGFLAWLVFIRKERLKNILLMGLGGITAVFIGILIDHWFYGEWTITAWNYFTQNIVNDKASAFGVSPWYGYLKGFSIRAIPPFSLLFVIGMLALFVFRWKSCLTWSLIPFLLVHFIVGHKELRFLFPIVTFLPALFILGTQEIEQRMVKGPSQSRGMRAFMGALFVVYGLMLIVVMFRPSDANIPLYKALYYDFKEPVTLYHLGYDPYDRVLDVRIYRRNNLYVERAEDLDSIPQLKNRHQLIVFRYRDVPEGFGESHRLVYRTYPDWVFAFNVNNWMSRTQIWAVYDLNEKISQR